MAGLPAHPAEAERRGAGRRRPPSASTRTACRALAREVADVAAAGVQIGVVVGGGNIFRGVAAAAQKMDRVTADHMGMLATVINSLALSATRSNRWAFPRA